MTPHIAGPPWIRWAVLIGATALVPGVARGQDGIAGRAELAVKSQNHWRGIRRSDAAAAEVAASAGIRVGDVVWLSAGGWSTFELSEANGHRRSDLRLGHWGRAESDVWVQAEINRPGWSVATGIVGEWFARSGPDAEAKEAFARLELISSTPAPRLEVWHDLDGGRGTYLELAGSWIVLNPLAGPGLNVVLSGIVGYAAGLARPERRTPGLPGFDGEGFTHTALRLDLRLTPAVGPVELTLDLRPELQWGFDPATKAWCAAPFRCERALRRWVSGSVGIALPRRHRP